MCLKGRDNELFLKEGTEGGRPMEGGARQEVIMAFKVLEDQSKNMITVH